VTGWQGNDGGQNQPYGPDPYGNDPYANQYGYGQQEQQYPPADPYQQPYGYQTGGFPAQAQDYGPPPPPKRSKTPMILSLVAIVIILGAVVAIVLVNRKTPQPAADDQKDTTSESTVRTSPSERQPSDRTTASGPTGGPDGWVGIDNTEDAGLSYQVPPDWEKSSQARDSGLDVEFTGTANYGAYDCEGNTYVRTFATSGDVQGKGGADLDLDSTVSDFAKSFATKYYGTDAKVEVPTPTDADVDGKTAVTVTAKITPAVTNPNCQATEGEVAIVGVLLEADGEPKGVAMLVVVNDLAGGPATPKPVEASVSQDILETVTVS
jgi:hypothetical protein